MSTSSVHLPLKCCLPFNAFRRATEIPSAILVILVDRYTLSDDVCVVNIFVATGPHHTYTNDTLLHSSEGDDE